MTIQHQLVVATPPYFSTVFSSFPFARWRNVISSLLFIGAVGISSCSTLPEPAGPATARRVAYTANTIEPPQHTTACTDWYNGSTGEYIGTTGDCSGGGGDYPDMPNPGPTMPSYEGGYNPGTGGVGSSGGSTSSINSTLPPCVDNILSNVRVTAENTGVDVGLMRNILAAVGAADAKIKIKYESSNLLTSSVGGDCRFVSRDNGYNSYLIRINQSFISGSSTDLLLAQIIIHETLHASLMDWGQRNGLSNTDMGFDNVLAYWMSSQRLNPSDAQGQHDAMSALVNQMGSLLYSYYLSVDHSASVGASQNQITSLNDCVNLCWTGLENTIGYTIESNRNPNFKNQCDVIRDAETHNTYSAAINADGTYTERFPAGQDPCK